MKVTTYEATVENGQIKLSEDVNLPENARVYVLVPGPEPGATVRIMSPHFVRREDAALFKMEVTEIPKDAELR